MPSGAAESASGLDGRPELGSGHLPQSPRSTLFSQFSVGGKPQFSAAQGSPIQGSGEIRIFGSCADSREPAGGVGQPWNEVSREVVWLRSGRRPWPGPFNLCLPSPPPLPAPAGLPLRRFFVRLALGAGALSGVPPLPAEGRGYCSLGSRGGGRRTTTPVRWSVSERGFCGWEERKAALSPAAALSQSTALQQVAWHRSQLAFAPVWIEN